jgi:DNA-binding winged helix-turn-helix (wHTH) protein/tetratricopeptide (TPR) repeat protein
VAERLAIDDRRGLDLHERRFWVDGEVVDLQPKVFDLLALLASRAGSLVRREEIESALWPDVHVTQASLYQVLRRARRALAGSDGVDPIETVAGAGYRLVVRPSTEAPTPPPPAARPPDPPPEGPPLVGRDAEVAALTAELRAGGAVSLWGPAGVGKSAVARALHRALPDVVWIRTDGARDSRAFEDALVRALGLGGRSELDRRAAARPGEVWILDPVEGRVDEVIGRLRARAPRLGWLVISRTPAGPPLRPVALGALPTASGDWRSSPAGRLFRTLLAARGVEVPADAAQLVAASGGLPLALDLLAARVARGGSSTERGVDDPVGSFGRAALDDLEEGDRLVFAALATFRRPATAASVEAVGGPELEPVEPRLHRLARVGLVVVDRGRCEIVAALRPLAEASASTEQRARWRRRHAEVHARHGHPWLAVSYDVHGSSDLRRQVALELEDVEQSIETALADGDNDTAAAAWLGGWLVWALRGPADRAAELGRRVWARPLSEELRVRLAIAVSPAVLRAGAVAESVRVAEVGLELARQSGDRHRAGLMGISLGVALKSAGRPDDARSVYETARSDLRAAGDQRAVGVVLTNLGALAFDSGDLAAAEGWTLEAAAAHLESGNRRMMGITARNLAQLRLGQARWADAEEACEAALAHHRVCGDLREEAHDHGILSELRRRTGDLARAVESSRAALALLVRVGDVRAEGLERIELAELLLLVGAHEEARLEALAAIAADEAAGNEAAAARARAWLAAMTVT